MSYEYNGRVYQDRKDPLVLAIGQANTWKFCYFESFLCTFAGDGTGFAAGQMIERYPLLYVCMYVCMCVCGYEIVSTLQLC
jgi:hypothetical protein